jgi:hypothetical protein
LPQEIRLNEPEDTIQWTGDISNVTFAAAVSDAATAGPKAGSVFVYAHGLQIARVHFVIEVGSEAREPSSVGREERPHSAFASYANADRNEVLARVQGIQKIAPDLDVFLDVVKLRSGQDWASQLKKEIELRDIFYLFWSDNARRSEWVEREWRHALACKGADFIDPVPLVSPEQVPPPSELASKHFNDWTLAFLRKR